jgi:hypothetical protein
VESGQIQIVDPTESTGSGHLTQEEWAARWAKYAAKNGTSTETVYMDENGHFWPVTLKTLGLAASTILLDGEELIVPTCTLLWETEAPVEQVLAVVTPTKQTYISIRAKSSKSSFKMGESP